MSRKLGLVFISLLVFSVVVTVSAGLARAEEWIHPKCRKLPFDHMGPFVTLCDGSVLAAGRTEALVSSDDGKTWESRALFTEPDRFECRNERALLRTRGGTVLLAFLNEKERSSNRDRKTGAILEGHQLPVYVTRSLDEGKTWQPPQKIQDGWCGAIRSMIQLKSGRVVLGSQQAVYPPLRHVTMTYASDDDGKTWKKSNIIDLGKYGGFGSHGGGIEATLAELTDGRLWMLLRTYRGVFSESFSSDGGLKWEESKPSEIAASGSPGQLARLQSGRIMLLWNRFRDPAKRIGRRDQLSMAFSTDDGKTWSEPVVVASDVTPPGEKESDHRQSYPYVYERRPGELWITTMQGKVRIRLQEADFTAEQGG